MREGRTDGSAPAAFCTFNGGATMSARWKTAALVTAAQLAMALAAAGAELLVTGLTDPEPVNPNAMTDTWPDSTPSIATDGQGNWVCIWQSNNSLNGSIGDEPDILVSRSTDGGATWTPPAPVNTDAAIDGTTADTGPRVTTDGAGTWIAAWTRSGDAVSPTGTDPDIAYSRSTDNGLTWTSVAILNSTASSDGSSSDIVPDLATDGSGTWICVWQSDATVLGTGFDPDIFYAASTDNGESWGPTAVLNTRAGVDGSKADIDPRIATDGAGTWICTWRSADDLGGPIGVDYDILYSLSTNDGSTWSPQAVVNSYAYTDDARDTSPSVAVGADGTWVVAWNSDYDLGGTIGNDSDVLYSTSTDDGQNWSSAAPVDSEAATDEGPDGGIEIRVDASGAWFAVWTSSEVVNGQTGDSDLHYSKSCDPLAGWAQRAVLNTNADVDSASDRWVALMDDGAGYWLTPWTRFNLAGDEYGTDMDIFSARFDLGRIGDFDFDGDVDLADFAKFAHCYAGPLNPPAPSCGEGINADFDSDGDVDLADFSSFAENFTGSR